MKSWGTILALSMCLLGGASPTVRADEPTDKQAQARHFYEEGQTAYSLGKFDKAIELYQKAYELAQRPSLLFNIAQSYRLAKNPERAKFFYESYLRQSPDAPNRADVEQRITEMNAALARDAATPTTTRRLAHPGLRIAGITTLALGAVAVGVGVYFGTQAASYADQVDHAPNDMWTDALSQAAQNGKDANTNMWILYGVGGALVVTGTVLLFVSRKTIESPTMPPPERTAWMPVVTPHGGGLVLRGSF